MATFGNPTYSTANYQANRPRYRDTLAETITAFHKRDNPGAATDLAVDVATGTGIFARQLPPHFTKVIGTDISPTMLQDARAATAEGSVEYIQAPSENMPFINDHTVDVLTVATGAHWFDTEKFVQEAKRVLKPNGTLAIFGYSGFAHFVDYPQCDKILKDYGLGTDKLGPFWDSGRGELVDGYRCYHRILTRDSWEGFERHIYPDTIEGEPSTEFPPTVASEPIVMDFRVTWRSLLSFLLTWSAIPRYQTKYPGRENPIEAAVREMMAAAGSTDMDEVLSLQWEEVLVLCHPPRPGQ
ncbi:trans-aconitate methyltransferase 1 [Coemansia sp. RSA 552]|nr:trans-aconitate methyltransferase 1 [Coemansia sp. RSA 552]